MSDKPHAYAEHSLPVTGLQARPVSRTPSTEPVVFPAGRSQQMTRVARASLNPIPSGQGPSLRQYKMGEGTAVIPSARCPSATSGKVRRPTKDPRKGEPSEREFAAGQRRRRSLSVTRVTGLRRDPHSAGVKRWRAVVLAWRNLR